MRRLFMAWMTLFLASGCGPEVPSHDSGPTGTTETALTLPSVNPVVTAAPTTNVGEIRVTWTDFPDEASYRLFSTTSPNPGPLFEGGGIGTSWTQVVTLGSNQTSFFHQTFSDTMYAVCAFENDPSNERLIEHCFGPSARGTPKPLFVAAEVNRLVVTRTGKTSIGVSWVESFATETSLVSISPAGTGPSSVRDDPDENFNFTGLRPGTVHTITACVQSSDQLADGTRTCRSIRASTLPDVPLAIDSVSVSHTDPSPRSRTVSFTHDNVQTNAVSAYLVRLIQNDTVLQDMRVVPDTYGPQTHRVTFSNLEPFSDYEAWVIPYNTAVGPSAGVNFTTPAEAVGEAVALSGNSAMVLFEAGAPGDWSVERKDGTSWVLVGTHRVFTPGPQRLVLQGLTASQTVRLRWRFAFLRTVSAEFVAAPASQGAPEVLQGSIRSLFPAGGTLPLRVSATFLPTVSGFAEYQLQTKTTWGSWSTLSSTSGTFEAGAPVSLGGTRDMLVTGARVCRRVPKGDTAYFVSCSGEIQYATGGVPRL